jgi:hypothetical protein
MEKSFLTLSPLTAEVLMSLKRSFSMRRSEGLFEEEEKKKWASVKQESVDDVCRMNLRRYSSNEVSVSFDEPTTLSHVNELLASFAEAKGVQCTPHFFSFYFSFLHYSLCSLPQHSVFV